MTDFTDSDAYQIIWMIRRLFRMLSQASDKNLETSSISVADRAVMEFLYPRKMMSVPQIAEKYQVSRQHIQAIVNSLLDKKLVITKKNPNHKRSLLIMLNKKGRELFEQVLDKDQKEIEKLFARIPPQYLKTTRETLEALFNEIA